jgi:hypothetical protein
LLLQSDGQPWPSNPGQRYHRWVANVVSAVGLDPQIITAYSLRHSSIVRALLCSVPARVVAATHDTSVKMIEKHYSRYITEYSDDHARAALLQHEPPSGDNVVALAG